MGLDMYLTIGAKPTTYTAGSLKMSRTASTTSVYTRSQRNNSKNLCASAEPLLKNAPYTRASFRTGTRSTSKQGKRILAWKRASGLSTPK